MAQKGQEKGVTGPAPVVEQPGRVRNVVLVGHSGAGKTTLVEALLAATGTINRAGSVTEGTTVTDHDPAAIRQQRSVSLSAAALMHQGTKINLLDTPGYADFLGEVRAGLRAADAVLFVVGAPDGVDEATAALGRSAPRRACRGRWRSPGWTIRAPTWRRRSPRAAARSATTYCRSISRCPATASRSTR